MMKYNKLRIGTDCDGVIDDFWNPYITKFGIPKSDKEITKNVQRKLQYDKEFWTTLPVLHRPNFDITLYCTKRTSLKSYLRQWLEENNFPIAPIYQVLYQKGNKAPYVKGRVDVFIDDDINNFISMNLSGVPCLLMDNPTNKHFGPILKVYSLLREEIEDAFYLAKELNIFDNFKQYYDC